MAGFVEKPKGDNSWINGGFFVMQPEVFDYIKEDDTNLEMDPLQNTGAGTSVSWHTGMTVSGSQWIPLRDKTLLEELWKSGKAPWKVWPSNGY